MHNCNCIHTCLTGLTVPAHNTGACVKCEVYVLKWGSSTCVEECFESKLTAVAVRPVSIPNIYVCIFEGTRSGPSSHLILMSFFSFS